MPELAGPEKATLDDADVAFHESEVYLLGQTYLDPHPKELMLRNRV